VPDRPDNPSDWLSHPPAPNEARIAVAIGKNAKLNPELRDALDQFARSLREDADPRQRGVHANVLCPRVSIGECMIFLQYEDVSGI